MARNGDIHQIIDQLLKLQDEIAQKVHRQQIEDLELAWTFIRLLKALIELAIWVQGAAF